MNKVINSVLIVSSLALLGGACYKTAGTNVNLVGNTNVLVNVDSSTIDTSDWLTYTNEEYGFSFRYPKELFVNYISEENFPFSRTKISEAPIERLEDHFEATQGELNAEEKEIKDAVVDNKFYILLPSGIKVKTEILSVI